MQKVVILGAGGHARETLETFLQANQVTPQWELLGYIDDDSQKPGLVLNDYPVLGGFDWFASVDISNIQVICAIGDNAARYRMVRRAEARGLRFCNAIAPDAIISAHATFGVGLMIFAGAIINTQASIGDHVIVNVGVSVSHDSHIASFCNLNPGVHIAGNVQINTGVDVGMGTVVKQSVVIGEWSFIGAGSVVISDIPGNVTVVGLPAKVIKERKEKWYEQ
jgi:sugar O-acyltransferase (sialic acid O-acetyltransferase NeuD family)